MRFLKTLGMLALVAVATAACDGVKNPLDTAGTEVGPYVRFVSPTATAAPEDTARAIFRLPTPMGEDVSVEYTLGGTAVLGTDYVPVDAAGDVRTDVTSSGGTALLKYRLENTGFAQDTLRLAILPTATPGRTVDVDIASAQGVSSGTVVATGYIDRYKHFELTIEAPDE